MDEEVKRPDDLMEWTKDELRQVRWRAFKELGWRLWLIIIVVTSFVWAPILGILTGLAEHTWPWFRNMPKSIYAEILVSPWHDVKTRKKISQWRVLFRPRSLNKYRDPWALRRSSDEWIPG